MFKKIVSILLVLVILLSCLTACNESNNKKTANSTTITEFDISNYDTSSIEEKTQALKDYLTSINGKYTISGQVFSADMTEAVFIYSETGKLPALTSYEMGGMAWDETQDGNIANAIDWHKRCNGIVAFHWHWFMPVDIDDYSKGTGRWIKDFKNFDFNNTIIEGTKENELVKEQIEKVAGQLKRLELAGVPVIWRPLHEAGLNNTWWWGKSKYIYLELWEMVYDSLMNKHKLKNLIWVWNAQRKDWMPDPNTFDIAAWDNYSGDSLGEDYYNILKECAPDKMLALSECGPIPHANDMVEKSMRWLYWCTWYGDFVYKGENGTYTAADYTPLEELKNNYNSRYVITLDELPLWTKECKREMPNSVQTYIDTGYMPGGVPVWKDGQITLEFETGNQVNCLGRFNAKYSGGAMLLWRGKQYEAEAIIPFNVPEGGAGEYIAEIRYMSEGSKKLNDFLVNGLSTGLQEFPEYKEFAIKEIPIELKEGVNYVGFSHQVGGWGWMNLDCVTLKKVKK